MGGAHLQCVYNHSTKLKAVAFILFEFQITQDFVTDKRTDGQTDGRTDKRTESSGY